MKKFFVILALFIFSVPTFAATRFVTTSTPMRNHFYRRPSVRSYSPIRRTYRPTPREIRRQQRLMRNYNRYPNYYNRVRSYYPGTTTVVTSDNSTSKIGNFFSNLRSSFFGTPTGLTPPVNPYYSYGSNSYGSDYGHYQDYYGNRGWAIRDKQVGSGGGVHIID